MAKFNTDEKVDILIKKHFGTCSTDTSLVFYSEPTKSVKRVFSSQICSEVIPDAPPHNRVVHRFEYASARGHGHTHQPSAHVPSQGRYVRRDVRQP